MVNNNLPVTKNTDIFAAALKEDTIRATLKNALGEHADAFRASMFDLYSGDTTLQKCNPRSVAMECLKAATLKLPISKALGFAYVVPYGDTPTFIIGYKGLIQLAQRTGLYKTLNAAPVYEGVYRGENWLTGEIDLGGEKINDTVVGYVAYFRLINGFEKALYMTSEHVAAHAKKYSKSFNSNYSPWKTEFDKMACKTVLRQLLSKYGPMTIDMQGILDSDDNAEDRSKRTIMSNANMVDVDMQSAPDQPQITAAAPVDEAQPEIKPEF
jgi:recombinase, phage RecT family